MLIDFDKFNRYEKPVLTLAYVNRKEIGQLGSYIKLKAELVFNGTSEISFEYPQKCEDGKLTNLFDEIKENRLIFTDNLGRYVITKVSKTNDGITNKLSVSASSLEYELNYKKLTLFNGTYKFYDYLKPDDSLLGKITTALGNWKVGYVSSQLCTEYRTFEISDDTVYSFLTGTVSTSYSCIFQFNTYNQTISAYTIEDIIKPTDIYITYENLIKNQSIETESEGIYTALSCYGGNDLSIATVNPMGGATIYKFDNCFDDMSDELVKAVKIWKTLFNEKKDVYQTKLLSIKDHNAKLNTLNSELVELNSNYQAKKEVQSAKIQASLTDTTEYRSLVAEMNDLDTKIKSKQKEIDSEQSVVNSIKSELSEINNQLSFKNKNIFRDSLYNELQYFIRETTYQDDSFTQTSEMTLVEIQDMSQNLYNQGIEMLDKISQSRFNITVNSLNYLFLPEFKGLVNSLDSGSDEKVKQLLGCFFNLEVNDDEYIQPILLSISLDFDNPKDFSMKFANRYKLTGGTWTLSELMSEVGKVGHSTSFTYSSVKDFTSYKGDLLNFMNSSLDATKNQLVNDSNNIEMSIDKTGLIGKRINLSTGDYYGEQVWLTNNILAFSKDKFNTVSTALGKVLLSNGSYDYGLNANVLIGKQIFGSSLTISNENNTINMDQDGFKMVTNNNVSKMLLSPSTGIKIQTNNAGTWADKFTVDNSGNALFAGTLKATDGDIGGFLIGGSYLKSKNELINLKSDGTGRLGLLTWTQSSATFDGNIYAKNLDYRGITSDKLDSGSVTNSKIDYDAVTSSKISDGAVTPNKLDRVYCTEAVVNSLIADSIRANNLVAKYGTFSGSIQWNGGSINCQSGKVIINGYTYIDSLYVDSGITTDKITYGTNKLQLVYVNDKWGNECKVLGFY